MRLEDLIIERPTAQVQLRGMTVTLRPLTSAERQKVANEHYPPPRPPLRAVQDKHGTRFEVDHYDPEHNTREAVRMQALRAGQLAIAMEFEPKGLGKWAPDMDPKRGRAWLEAASRELDGVFTNATIKMLFDRLTDLEQEQFSEREQIGDETAPGNSSDQRPTAAGAGDSPSATA